MKPVAFASVVIRGVSLWLLVNSVSGVALAFQRWSDAEPVRQAQVLGLLAGTILPVATALLVWTNADWLAARVASVDDESAAAAATAWNPRELLRLAVATVGLVTLVAAATELVWYSSVFVSLNASRDTAFGRLGASDDLRLQFWDVAGKANFASTVGRTLLGLLLVLKPRSVADLVGRGDGTDDTAGANSGDSKSA